MAFWEDNSNVTATIPTAAREELERNAASEGLSLSKYVGRLLQQAVPAQYGVRGIYCRPARLHGGSFVITIPREIVDGLSITDRQPLSWSLGRGGALVRPVVV